MAGGTAGERYADTDAAALATGLVGGLVVRDDASGILTKERLMKAGDSMVQATAQTVLAQARSGTIAKDRATRESAHMEAGARSDRLELSDAALENIQSGGGGVRTELVERVRGEIAAGTYLTDEKLNAVVDRLHRVLFR